MMSIEQAGKQVREASRGLATWIRKQTNVYEESLTDRLLYELSDSPLRLFSKKFTRHQESRESGADWDWWFVLRRGSIGFRFQAKKVTSGKDHYQDLARMNRVGLQVKLLLESARAENLLAFYALYSGGTLGAKTMCGGGPEIFMSEGVFLAAAQNINERFIRSRRSRVEAHMLLDCSNPLACLFCCPMIRELAVGELGAFYHYIAAYYPDLFSASPNDSDVPPGFHDELPSHVASLLQFRDEEVPVWWENEHMDIVRNTKAIAILDLRDTK